MENWLFVETKSRVSSQPICLSASRHLTSGPIKNKSSNYRGRYFTYRMNACQSCRDTGSLVLPIVRLLIPQIVLSPPVQKTTCIPPTPHHNLTRSRPFVAQIHTHKKEGRPVHFNHRGTPNYANHISTWEDENNTPIIQMAMEDLWKILSEAEIKSPAHVNLPSEAAIQAQSAHLRLASNCQFNHRFPAATCFTPLVFLDLANRLAGHPAQPTYTGHPVGQRPRA